VTRNGWVAAGLPWHVPATTVDRQCGSSQQAMHFVAASVMAGLYDVAIACGVESMSRAPMASNAKGGTGPFSQDFLQVVDGKLWAQFQVAQVLADKWKITRDDMDEFALESHRRAAAATDSGHFAREILPVPAEDPGLVLAAPNPVTRKLLARSGMSIDDFDAMECNEAFAAIALMWAREFLPDSEKYNPNGGAIAIGHPLGATGVRMAATVLNQ